jgi:hypothetical protein
MLDLALPRPPPTIPEATVDLFEMMGLFPPIRREGPSPDNKYPRSVCVSRCLEGPRRIFHFRVVSCDSMLLPEIHEQGKQVLGIIMLDLALPRPPPTIPEATVDLFVLKGRGVYSIFA